MTLIDDIIIFILVVFSIKYHFCFQTCPLLLRVFCNTGRHHMLSEYARGNTPANELQIYTWLVGLMS